MTRHEYSFGYRKKAKLHVNQANRLLKNAFANVQKLVFLHVTKTVLSITVAIKL